MRRATSPYVVCACAVALLAAGRVHGQHTSVHTKQATVQVIDAIGLVDATKAPTFKVGSWIKYDATGHTLAGLETDYEMTVTIAGEELFWGEECFWVETLTAPRESPPITLSTLMSYSMFDPSLPSCPVAYFQRKTISELDMDGNPIQTILKRATQAMITKDKGQGFTLLVDTLGTERISTPKGEFECLKIRERRGVGTTEELGDSTRYTEQRETRITYRSPLVPISGLVRTEIEVTEHRKTWMVGASSDVPQNLMDRSTLRSDVVDFGEGRPPGLTPIAYQKPIKRPAWATGRKP